MPYYWKEKHIPDKCPKCGRTRASLETDNLGAAFREYMLCWSYRRVKRHWFWRMKCWYASCGTCLLREAMAGTSIFDKIVKENRWRGGTLRLPFKTSR